MHAKKNGNRLVLITGVSRGLGAALARGFASRGDRIAGCARPSAELEVIAGDLGGDHFIAPVDVSDEEDVATFAATVFSRCGTPDLLINGAAIINAPAPLWEIPAGEVSALFDINLKGTIHFIRHFTPAMIDQGSGVIVNFSSGWGRSTSPEVAPYCASKWAIEGLTQALAQELPRGLAAVAFNPGIIDTDMLRTCFGDSAAHYPDAEEWAKAAVPYLAALGPRDNGKALTCPGH
jgi:NAD(P)-dependent dehydrogenase (short-subunit alcohol dehydrogenase family)